MLPFLKIEAIVKRTPDDSLIDVKRHMLIKAIRCLPDEEVINIGSMRVLEIADGVECFEIKFSFESSDN